MNQITIDQRTFEEEETYQMLQMQISILSNFQISVNDSEFITMTVIHQSCLYIISNNYITH